MKIGRLRHRLELQEQQETQDPNTGAITKEWVALRDYPRASQITFAC